jgi:hypothetical protein
MTARKMVFLFSEGGERGDLDMVIELEEKSKAKQLWEGSGQRFGGVCLTTLVL